MSIDTMLWDWETTEKKMNLKSWQQQFGRVESVNISPDGETVAAVVLADDGFYSVCENGTLWENSYEKLWSPFFMSDGTVGVLGMTEDLWTVAFKDSIWSHGYDYVWHPLISPKGNHLAVAVKTENRYSMAVDDDAWQINWANITDMSISHDGGTVTATVQTEPLSEGDIDGFQKGIFTVAVNGAPWKSRYVNVWKGAINKDGSSVAAQVRLNLYDYTIAVDGTPWPCAWQCVWEPVFHPITSSVTAPVRVGQKWTLAENGTLIWKHRFSQLWQHQYSENGEHIAAIAAPEYGKWTIAVDDNIWKTRFHGAVSHLTLSRDGKRVVATGIEGKKRCLVENDVFWDMAVDRIWKPVMDDAGEHIAVKIETDGHLGIAVDGDILPWRFDRVCDPVFHENGKKILIKGILDQVCYRVVHTF